MSAIYLLFTEGYAATAGVDWTRPALCREAVRVATVLASLVPQESEAHGLLALVELQSSRLAARQDGSGEAVLLNHQDRSAWDRTAIERGITALDAALALDGDGPYVLQAAIAAEHASAASVQSTDWPAIAALYERLARVTGSAVVELNRAVALGMAYGPEVGLQLLDQVAEIPTMADYHLLPSVRGDLLERLGRHDEATAEFRRAASLATNDRERALLTRRAEKPPGSNGAPSPT
jgi:predicted RNA polymerase sigma factor